MVQHSVIIKYGPYESCHTVKHTENRLEGLIYMLEEDGHKITLQQADERNYVELVIHEEVVFRCKIQDLNFGGDGKLDALCTKALDAVRKAY